LNPRPPHFKLSQPRRRAHARIATGKTLDAATKFLKFNPGIFRHDIRIDNKVFTVTVDRHPIAMDEILTAARYVTRLIHTRLS
jgi:hypothetical protein